MILVELGPGHGTLTKDILNFFKKGNLDHKIDSVHLVETSPLLQKIQKETLSSVQNLFFHENIDTLPNSPAFFVANEFFDAFPIQQFWKGQEICLVLEDGQLKRQPNPPDDEIEEFSPQSIAYFEKILSFLKQNGGVFIIIDYGFLEVKGNSLQAVQSHQYADPFQNPGQRDLTAHVNFGKLKHIAELQGFKTHFTTQGDFLRSLGIQEYGIKHPPLLNDIHRLISSSEMGELFKVLVIWN